MGPGGQELAIGWGDGGVAVDEAVLGEGHFARFGFGEDFGEEDLLLVGGVGVPYGEV